MIQNILNHFSEESFLKADGLDEAILGVEQSSMRLIYSVKKIIEILSQEMSTEEAYEYFSFNIESAYVGEQTPIFCYDDF